MSYLSEVEIDKATLGLFVGVLKKYLEEKLGKVIIVPEEREGIIFFIEGDDESLISLVSVECGAYYSKLSAVISPYLKGLNQDLYLEINRLIQEGFKVFRPICRDDD